MSARDLNETARLIDACDRHLAALRAAHPDGVPNERRIEPMTDGEALAAELWARREVERVKPERAA